jgi:hypothetical protein
MYLENPKIPERAAWMAGIIGHLRVIISRDGGWLFRDLDVFSGR